MVKELKAELLSGRIQKINQPFEQELVLQIRGNRKIKTLALSPFCLWTDSTDPDQSLKILPFPIPLLWLCANIFKALSSKGLSKWKTTDSRNPCLQ